MEGGNFMNPIHSAIILMKKEYDDALHDYFVVIKEVKIYDIENKEIRNKVITDCFIDVKNNETDYVLVEHVAQKLGISESNVTKEYI